MQDITLINIGNLVIALTALAVSIVQAYRNRGRISFRLLTAMHYVESWSDEDERTNRTTYARFQNEDPKNVEPPIKAESYRKTFTILEFSVTNHYARVITIGRFLIDDWMFSAKYTRGLDDHKRDYRVFDLFTKQPTSLDNMVRLGPGETYGLRVEVLEEASGGPVFGRVRDYYVVDLPTSYKLEFLSDVGKFHYRLPLPRKVNPLVMKFAYRWSEDLIGPFDPEALGSERPQGVKVPKIDRQPFILRLRLLWYRIRFRLRRKRNNAKKL